MRAPERMPRVRGDDLLRLASSFEINDDGCWVWMRHCLPDGYGRAYDGRTKRQALAHRWSYGLLVGEIPAGLTLDHLCKNTSCVNPDHLEPVTQAENNMRGNGWSGRNARKTECPQGHPYDELNTYIRPDGGRDCKECINRRSRERNERRRQARAFR